MVKYDTNPRKKYHVQRPVGLSGDTHGPDRPERKCLDKILGVVYRGESVKLSIEAGAGR